MRARPALLGLILLIVTGGAGACAHRDVSPPAAEETAAGNPTAETPATGPPASAEPAATPGEDHVVAYDSATLGGLEVESVRDNPHDWFLVLQDGERALPGNPPLLNTTAELAPGTYEVDVNHTRRTVTIHAGEKAVVWTGELTVEGEPEGAYWYPMEGTSRRVASNPPVVNSALALFPGTYTVFVHTSVAVPDTDLGATEVVAGQRTVLRHP